MEMSRKLIARGHLTIIGSGAGEELEESVFCVRTTRPTHKSTHSMRVQITKPGSSGSLNESASTSEKAIALHEVLFGNPMNERFTRFQRIRTACLDRFQSLV